MSKRLVSPRRTVSLIILIGLFISSSLPESSKVKAIAEDVKPPTLFSVDRSINASVTFNNFPDLTLIYEFYFFGKDCAGEGIQNTGDAPVFLGRNEFKTDANGVLNIAISLMLPEGVFSGFLSEKLTIVDEEETTEISGCVPIEVGATIKGSVEGQPNTSYMVNLFYFAAQRSTANASGDEVHANEDCSNSSAQSLGSFPVDIGPDGTGDFTVSPPTPPAAGFINGTATAPSGATSPSSACLPLEAVIGVTAITRQGKKLFVGGVGFDSGSTIFINGEKQKTANDEANPTLQLIGKKAGKKISTGDKLQVRISSGQMSPAVTYVKP
jgi:hypothetical protein